MPGVDLYPYQAEAIERMKNGCILCGSVGSGKSRTGIGYYVKTQGGTLTPELSLPENARDLYIITTAQKRDKHEWFHDLLPFMLAPIEEDLDFGLTYWGNHVFIDSWNNIKKYKNVYGAFFIFDEDRVTGSGVWVKTFLDLARKNQWIILSATPGDRWIDYAPVFVANGFYRNRTEFIVRHVVQNPHVQYFSVSRYLDEYTLLCHKAEILVQMDYKSKAIYHEESVLCDYNKELYQTVVKDRWNIYENLPIRNAAEYGYVLRKVVNSDPSRIERLHDLLQRHDRIVTFYNFNYELDILYDYAASSGITISQWNGRKHEDLPNTKRWLYVVQYNSGSEGWNCIETNAMIFFSQNHSYRMTKQASGRIDRTTSPFLDLYYYYFRSEAHVDRLIKQALDEKRDFNANDAYRDIQFA